MTCYVRIRPRSNIQIILKYRLTDNQPSGFWVSVIPRGGGFGGLSPPAIF